MFKRLGRGRGVAISQKRKMSKAVPGGRRSFGGREAVGTEPRIVAPVTPSPQHTHTHTKTCTSRLPAPGRATHPLTPSPQNTHTEPRIVAPPHPIPQHTHTHTYSTGQGNAPHPRAPAPGPAPCSASLAPRGPASQSPSFLGTSGRRGPSGRSLSRTCGSEHAPPTHPAPLQARPAHPARPGARKPARPRPLAQLASEEPHLGRRSKAPVPPRPRPAHRPPAASDGSRERPGLRPPREPGVARPGES